jgi:acetyl-CoA synthetase
MSKDIGGVTIRDGFGQTETTALIGNTPGSPVKPGSMGRPLPGVGVEIVDPVTGGPPARVRSVCGSIRGR